MKDALPDLNTHDFGPDVIQTLANPFDNIGFRPAPEATLDDPVRDFVHIAV
jgi:hypothetical protein